MSSNSEENYYGNLAKRLQIEKRTFEFDSATFLKELEKKMDSECGTSRNSGTTEEISLDAIIANNSKILGKKKAKREAEPAKILPEKILTLDSKCGTTRATRAAKRAAKDEDAIILPEKNTRTKRYKKEVLEVSELPPIDLSKMQDIQETTNEPELPSMFDYIVNSTKPTRARGRGRGRSRGRGRQSPRRGGRGRRGARAAQQSPMAQDDCPDMKVVPDEPIDLVSDIDIQATSKRDSSRQRNNRQQTNMTPDGPYPTYSVGNTAEYPDQSDGQQLFSSKPKPKPKPQNDVIINENDQDSEDNEEISVKIYWQSSDFVKFNLRPNQRLTPIFDHFAVQEKCSHDYLLFSYNGKILKSGDTPRSINYNFVKFIDGGVINQSLSSLLQGKIEDGIKLKFQCLNVRKPFLASIRADEKMVVVMMKCAEHLQKPLNKLKFYFDGDLISDSDTPTELELEGGECIDVNIIN